MISLIVCCLLVGCTNQTPEDKQEKIITSIEDVKVGFSQMENNGPWRVAETNSIMAEAEFYGVELVYTDAKGSVTQQIEDVRYLVTQDIDYLLLAPKKYDEYEEALLIAKEAEVKVILVDRSCKGIPGEDYLTLINSDHIWESERAGELLAEKMNYRAKIVELSGTEGSSSAIERSLGFRHIIDQYTEMEIVISESADFNRAEGKRVMANIIREYKDEITAIYAHNDEMAIGAIMALKAAGIEPGEDVIVISMDGEKDALKAIISKDLYATVECTPYLGPTAFDVINKDVQGLEIEQHFMNEDRIFTIDNAAEYIDIAF